MLRFWRQMGRPGHDRSNLKTGDMVRFMDRRYRVGTCMTSTSIELNELEYPLRGLWVSRDEVHAVSPDDQKIQQKQRA
ncbi:MAG: hypothetical protein HQ515_03475 [Phycisphaeraceae bacterium]|nr:hypothetical protein [Phycisphaeraceae bacterium]